MLSNTAKQEWVSFFFFAILIIAFKFGFHQLWKDEWQAWFVASDLNLVDMLAFLNYEGHPALWYLYLKVFSILEFILPNNAENIIQLAHCLPVLGFLYLFFKHFNLPIYLKILLASGYFLGFEYGIVNRGYALVLFISFWLTILLGKEQTKSKWLIPLLFFLLCQTEVYGVLIALGLGFHYLANGLIQKHSFANLIKSGPILSIVLGVVVFVITVFPRGNGDDFTRAYNQEILSVETILNSFQGLTTNTFLIGLTEDTSRNGYSWLGIFMGILVLFSIIWCLRSKRINQLSIAAGFLMFFGFSVLIFNGGVRQWGMFFIYFLCLAHLSFSTMNKAWSLNYIPLIVFGVFMMVHNFKAFNMDLQMPFTNAQLAGAFIKEKVPENVPIISLNKFESTPVIGYANRSFNTLPTGEEFTFFKWLEKVYVPTQSEVQLFGKFKNVGGVIMLSPKPIDSGRFPQAKLWQKFDGANFKQENYYIYTLNVE